MTVVQFVVTPPADGGDTAVLAVKGEIDVSNVEEFGRNVDECLRTSCRVVSMDMAGLTFIDSSGLRIIVEANKRLRERDGQLVIKDPPAILRRIVEVSGLTDFFGLTDEAPPTA